MELSPNIITLIESSHSETESFGRPGNLYTMVLAQYGLSLSAVGKFEEGIQSLERAAAFVNEIEDPYARWFSEFYHACLCLFRSDGAAMIRLYRNCISRIETVQIYVFLGMCWTWLGLGHHLVGETETALDCIQKGLQIQEEYRVPFWLSSQYYTLSWVHYDLGNLEKARAYSEEALSLSKKAGEKLWYGSSVIGHGRILAKMRAVELDEAEALMKLGIRLLEDMRLRPLYSVGYLRLGELYKDAGRIHEALESLKKAEGMFREMGMDYWLGKTQEVLARL